MDTLKLDTMEKKVVIVTGANGSLGKAVTKEFLHNDWKVVGIVHHHEENLDENENFVRIQADLMAEEAGDRCAEEAIHRFGAIDSAVLTTGGFKLGDIENTGLNELTHFFRLNFVTAYNLVRPLFHQMKKQGSGTLFLVGSEPGMDTSKATKTVAYSLSKSLLFQLANIINAQTKETGVKAYVIVPRTIDTLQNRESMPNADYSKWQNPKMIAEIVRNHALKTTSDSAIIEISKFLAKAN